MTDTADSTDFSLTNMFHDYPLKTPAKIPIKKPLNTDSIGPD